MRFRDADFYTNVTVARTPITIEEQILEPVCLLLDYEAFINVIHTYKGMYV